MMNVRVTHTIDDLARDAKAATTRVVRQGPRIVSKNVRAGQAKARANSRRTSGSHGKRHAAAITSEMTGLMTGEWGPDRNLPQGNMDFEYGGGYQSAPHLPVTKSADVQVPQFRKDVADLADTLPWGRR